MSDEILIVEGLKKHFIIGHDGTVNRQPITVKAVDGVNFELREGETLGLVGESGSGKSTIAYIAVGMYQPSEGTMYFRGEDLFARNLERPLSLRRDIQIVFNTCTSTPIC
jgi:peptide/nickel transport system ATP-binding protein